MAAWPPVGGGRMVSTVNTITPWASPEAMLAVTSFHIVHRPWRLSAVSREASRVSEPPEPLWRKTVKWSRPTAEEVCGGRNRPARRCRCTRVSGWDVQSRRAVVRRAFLPRAISSASAHRPRGGKRGMSGHAAVGDFRSESHARTLVRANSRYVLNIL